MYYHSWRARALFPSRSAGSWWWSGGPSWTWYRNNRAPRQWTFYKSCNSQSIKQPVRPVAEEGGRPTWWPYHWPCGYGKAYPHVIQESLCPITGNTGYEDPRVNSKSFWRIRWLPSVQPTKNHANHRGVLQFCLLSKECRFPNYHRKLFSLSLELKAFTVEVMYRVTLTS